MNTLEILKFGGTSVCNAEALMQSASVVGGRLEQRKGIVIIPSAMNGVTDQLIKVTRNAIRNSNRKTEQDPLSQMGRKQAKREEKTGLDKAVEDGLYNDVLDTIRERHKDLIKDTVDPKLAVRLGLGKMVDDTTERSRHYITSMVNLEYRSPRYLDLILAKNGEGLMAAIFRGRLLSMDMEAVLYQAEDIIVTDGNYGDANPQINQTRDRCRETDFVRDTERGRLVVLSGFSGADKDGNITTLGRGGTDTSATTMARVLKVFCNDIGVYLYKADKELAGVMTADPKIVRGTRSIPHMLYDEAGVFTALGGKVIHSKAVRYVENPNIPLFVKSTVNPYLEGTRIDGVVRPEDPPIKAISVLMNIIRADLTGSGMDQPGIAREFFRVLAEHEIDVRAIIQSFSLRSLMAAWQFDPEETDVQETCASIKEDMGKALRDHIQAQNINKDIIVKPSHVIGIVGSGCLVPCSRVRIHQAMASIPELENDGVLREIDGDCDISFLIDLPDDRVRAVAQSTHDSVFDKVTA